MLYYVIDAFTDTRFGGNPAGVVIYDHLEEQFMQQFAAEVRFSETAYVKQIDGATFHIRYFTPTDEVELCGHATVAAFKALMDCQIVKDNHSYFIKTLAGDLTVSVRDSFILMEQAAPKEGTRFEDLDALSKLFHLDADDIGDQNFHLVPQAISTGFWDIIMPVKSKEALTRMQPNFKAIAEFCSEQQVGGFHAFSLDEDQGDACCRNFAPLYGINEEAATGTASGALTYYLYLQGLNQRSNQEYLFLQGQNMGRPSAIKTKLIIEDRVKVYVGGNAVILTKGTII